MRPFLLLPVLLALSPLPATAEPSTSELAELYLPAEINQLQLSPDGTHAAFIGRRGDKYAVGLYDLTSGRLELSDPNSSERPLALWWKSPRRLLVQTSSYRLQGRGFTAFDIDGKNREDLWRLAKLRGQIIDAQIEDPRSVLMLDGEEILRANLDSGNLSTIDRAPMPGYWTIDARGRARALWRHDAQHGETLLWWNSAPGGEWRLQRTEAGAPRFSPAAVDTDGGNLWGWVWGAKTGINFARFDTHTGAWQNFAPIAGSPPTHLLSAARKQQPIAVVYAQASAVQLRALTDVYRDAVARLQQTFAGFLPSIVDILPDGKTWLVWIGNSRLPGAYFQFDSTTGQATLIGLSHSAALVEEKLAASQYFRFPRRNGGTLSARIWRPPGSKGPLPLIVLCPESLPAGPSLDLYRPPIQAMPAPGFAVLEGNVRRTPGLPQHVDLTQAADWTSFVQEDLEDAVDDLVRHNIADPRSVNLLGGRFGGVLAVGIATRSSRFTAMAALNVVAKFERDDFLRFTNETGLNVLSDSLGGWLASARLASSLSPVEQIPQLRIPALFLHDESSSAGKPNDDGRMIKAALDQAKVPTKAVIAFSWADRPKMPSVLARENAEISRHIAAFFRSTATR